MKLPTAHPQPGHVMPRLLCTVLALMLPFWVPAHAEDTAFYSWQAPSPDGTGKLYMGREIAHVMGHLGAGWLERSEREREERTDLLLKSLGLQPGDTVADIGAGTGYFTLPIARSVGKAGHVFAVDIQQEMLDIIDGRVQREALSNVSTVLGTPSDPGLPVSAVDAVLLVDAYHEFSHPREVMSAIRDSLATDGRVYLVEYRGEDRSVPIKRLHKMTVAQARKELDEVGLTLEQVRDELPWQHIMVFRRAAVSPK